VFGNPDGGGLGLHVAFTTRAGDQSRPAECQVSVYNLSPESVGVFTKTTNLVTIRAGHASGGVRQVFSGNPVAGTLVRHKQGGDVVTKVTIRDGGRAYDFGRLEVSLSGKTTEREVLNHILAQSGLGEGHVELTSVTFPRRYVFSGTARRALDELVDAMGPSVAWFIRDGNVHILDKASKTPEEGPVFSSDLGNLVGSPEPVEGGGIRFKGLLDPSVRVGKVVKVESKYITGWFKVVEAAFAGDNFSSSFYVNVKGVAYAT